VSLQEPSGAVPGGNRAPGSGGLCSRQSPGAAGVSGLIHHRLSVSGRRKVANQGVGPGPQSLAGWSRDLRITRLVLAICSATARSVQGMACVPAPAGLGLALGF
jgi:hypothetical protein